jgi:hypothetical protein
MKILILKSIKSHGKYIDFSKVSLEEQIGYIIKETQELDNAVTYLDTHGDTQENRECVAQEDLDVIQTCIQHLHLLAKQGVDVKKELKKHNNKLTNERNAVIEEVLEIGTNVCERGILTKIKLF